MVEARYSGFLKPFAHPSAVFSVELHEPAVEINSDEELQVGMEHGIWYFQRGDFSARWDPRSGSGHVRQSANPYSIDSVLRIVHSLILASAGGILIHAASAIRGGRAYLFSGVSGAGKTTISRLAPPDVTFLTDEISYVLHTPRGYYAYGTPFSGEMAMPGENCSAPLDTIFLLEKGKENRIEPVSPAEALRALMRNILFFAHDHRLVEQVFETAYKLSSEVPIQKLIFAPDPQVWEIIGATTGVLS